MREVNGKKGIRGIRSREDAGSRGWKRKSSGEKGSRQNWLVRRSDQKNPIEWAFARQCKVYGLFLDQPPTMSRPLKRKRARWPKTVNEAGKCIRENTGF